MRGSLMKPVSKLDLDVQLNKTSEATRRSTMRLESARRALRKAADDLQRDQQRIEASLRVLSRLQQRAGGAGSLAGRS